MKTETELLHLSPHRRRVNGTCDGWHDYNRVVVIMATHAYGQPRVFIRFKQEPFCAGYCEKVDYVSDDEEIMTIRASPRGKLTMNVEYRDGVVNGIYLDGYVGNRHLSNIHVSHDNTILHELDNIMYNQMYRDGTKEEG